MERRDVDRAVVLLREAGQRGRKRERETVFPHFVASPPFRFELCAR
jgi:hypothetical protein